MKSKSQKRTSIMGWGLVVLVVLLFLIFAYRIDSSKVVKISDHDPVTGIDDAPVTVVMFGSYHCSVSRQFFDEIYPWLKEQYVDTAKVKFVYKNFYASHDFEKILAAEASLCAHEQGMFWPYNSILFDRGKEWSQKISASEAEELFNPVFGKYATELGLDEKMFLECLYSHKYRAYIWESYDYAGDLGASKTPAFFINGLLIDGLPSLEDFESVLLKFSYG
nr:thioredoxin domain-containing protein [Nanoarchaeota archaeon]